MHFLVTGGAGFIGSHVVDRLLADEAGSVTVLDEFNDYYDPAIKRHNVAQFRGPVAVVEADLRDRARIDRLFDEGKFDVVIHLAGRAGVRPSILDPELYLDVNIKGTFNVLEAARRTGVERLLFASSSSVYGVNPKVPFAEDDALLATISPYAATKLAGEQLCSNYAYLYGLRSVCLRFFTVYGPRQRPDLAISKFCRAILEGRPVDKYGDGTTCRDYTYIEDIVDGVIGAVNYEGPVFDIFNLGGSQTVSLNDLIAACEEACGRPAIIRQMPMQPGDVPRTSADVSKARRLLGFEPHTSVHAGVRRFVEWWQALDTGTAEKHG
ncbi:MAG: SDR family NAD(P)-dependent oxidoreductase [Verrucomicrobiales bacterium]